MRVENTCQCCPPPCLERRPIVKAAAGLALLAAGVTMILVNTGAVDGAALAPYWPVLLLAVGLTFLVPPTEGRAVLTGVAWIVAGGLILTSNLGLVSFDVAALWPLILVYIGLILILRRFRRSSSATGGGSRPRSE